MMPLDSGRQRHARRVGHHGVGCTLSTSPPASAQRAMALDGLCRIVTSTGGLLGSLQGCSGTSLAPPQAGAIGCAGAGARRPPEPGGFARHDGERSAGARKGLGQAGGRIDLQRRAHAEAAAGVLDERGGPLQAVGGSISPNSASRCRPRPGRGLGARPERRRLPLRRHLAAGLPGRGPGRGVRRSRRPLAIVAREPTALWEDADSAPAARGRGALPAVAAILVSGTSPEVFAREAVHGGHDPSQPSNAIARCALEGGEVLKVQPDAMVAHSPGMCSRPEPTAAS